MRHYVEIDATRGNAIFELEVGVVCTNLRNSYDEDDGPEADADFHGEVKKLWIQETFDVKQHPCKGTLDLTPFERDEAAQKALDEIFEGAGS